MLKIELEQSGNTLLCRATQRGEELGRAEAEIREDTVWYRLAGGPRGLWPAGWSGTGSF